MNVSVSAWIEPHFLVIKSAISFSAQELTSWLDALCMYITPELSSPGRVEKPTLSPLPPSSQTWLHPNQANSCIWPAPVISGIQEARYLTYNSTAGPAASIPSAPSSVPACTIAIPRNASRVPVFLMALPQSGQKNTVRSMPLSCLRENVLGVPAVMENLSSATSRLTVWELPLILRHPRQWQLVLLLLAEL
jgi:hypothetical protein